MSQRLSKKIQLLEARVELIQASIENIEKRMKSSEGKRGRGRPRKIQEVPANNVTITE